MVGVADQHDLATALMVDLGLAVHLRHQWTGGVEGEQVALLGLLGNRLRHAMRGENDGRVGIRNLVELFHEDGALGLEAFDHVAVVYDLVAHIDRRTVAGERLLDRVDGAHDPGAKAARRAQQHLQRGLWVGSKGLGHRHYGPRLRPSLAPLDMALCPSSVKRRAGPKFPAERTRWTSTQRRVGRGSLRPTEP